jgi:LysM repeat protein
MAPALDATNSNVGTTSAPPIVEPTPAPIPTPVPTPMPTVSGQEYTIVKGDSFATIAKKFPGVSAKMIQDANPGVQPTKLKIGQKIQIPAPSVPTTGSAPTLATGGSSAGESYTVKSGDNLISIAKKFPGVTVKAIRAANNLTTDKIRVGQKLIIPTTPPPSAPAPAEPLTVPSAPAPTSGPAPTHP